MVQWYKNEYLLSRLEKMNIGGNSVHLLAG
jgi:hypothetical protein